MLGLPYRYRERVENGIKSINWKGKLVRQQVKQWERQIYRPIAIAICGAIRIIIGKA